MAPRYLVEFMAKWINDPSFRWDVLQREITTLQDFGLDNPQITDLVSLDKQAILARLQDELETTLGIDLQKVRDEKNESEKPNPANPLLAAVGAAAYTEGQPHVRATDPVEIAQNLSSIVIVRGQGFDPGVSVRFEKGTSTVHGQVLAASCDVDVFQRLTVRVTLDSKGMWKVVAKNADPADPDSVENVQIRVV